MTAKQDRISEAMKERIAQLEGELEQCKNHLNETLRQKETLEFDIDALQTEAHDVVSQWSEKASELQTQLDTSISNVKKLQNELSEFQNSNNDLKRSLQDLEAKNILYSEELFSLKQNNQEILQKLNLAEENFSSASERITNYEHLINKMDLEMKQGLEDIKTLSKEKSRLIDISAEIKEEKRRLEADFIESRKFSELLVDDLTNHKRSLTYLTSLIKISEEENKAREIISFTWENSFIDNILIEMRYYMFRNFALETKRGEIENNFDILNEENNSLKTELNNIKNEIQIIQKKYENTNNDLNHQISLLEKDIVEFQDSYINQKSILESLQEEFNTVVTQRNLLESVKEGLETEFTAIKECYSSLLIEHNELRVNEQKKQQEMSAKISFLIEEKNIIRNDYETRLHNLQIENISLNNFIASCKIEKLEFLEREERLLLNFSLYKEWLDILYDNNTQQKNCWHDMYTQFLQSNKELCVISTSMTETQNENTTLKENLSILKKDISLKQYNITILEKTVEELNSDLKTSKKNYEEVFTDNNWLKEQVESMRRELSDLDELLNSNLNDMREEAEKQQLEYDKLLSEIHRYKELLRQSQEKNNLLEERYTIIVSENGALSKTLSLTEEELLNVKRELVTIRQREKILDEQKKQIESKLLQLQKEHLNVDNQTSIFKEQLRTQEAKLQLISSSARQEMEAMKIKMNSFIEKNEESEQRIIQLSKSLRDSENLVSNLRDVYQKAKASLEEAKQRCCKDTETLQKLLEERKSLVKDRDIVVEKYNRVHDMLKTLKRENSGRLADEIHKLTDLCSQQEVELQQLRHQNVVLKKGIMKLPDSNNSQIERPMFVERLNVTEGPLRRPKKRHALSSDMN